MDEDVSDNVGGGGDEIEEDAKEEAVEEAAVNIKMGLTYQMSPVNLLDGVLPHVPYLGHGRYSDLDLDYVHHPYQSLKCDVCDGCTGFPTESHRGVLPLLLKSMRKQQPSRESTVD